MQNVHLQFIYALKVTHLQKIKLAYNLSRQIIMRVFTIFALIFHKIGFMAVIFLTTVNKNPCNVLPVYV